MKNLTTAFRTGDLRPKERVMLQVHNEVAKDKTGKEILTEADKHALGVGWRAPSNDLAREYNRYIEGWRLMGSAEIDAQTAYFAATAGLLRASRPIDMNVFVDGKKILEYSKTFSKNHLEGDENALGLILKNSGLELECVIHRYAFESLSEDLKNDMLALFPDAKTESQYFDHEEAIANAFSEKKTLTKEAKETLADAIVKSLYNKYANFFAKFDEDNDYKEEYFFEGYYAELPAFEILGKWAFYNSQMPKEPEDLLRHLPEGKEYANDSEEVQDVFMSLRKELTPRLTAYAKKHNKDVGEILKETLLRWLDDGLFTKDFTPIWNSIGKDTCNGVDTKLPHKDVLREWLQAKRKSEQALQGLIDSGELKVEDRVETIKRYRINRKKLEPEDEEVFKRTITLITGESLYNLKGDYSFASDYRKQADDLEGLGGMITFLHERRFLDDYAVVLAFAEIFKRLSKVFEIDLTYKTSSWLASFKDDTDTLNRELFVVAEAVRQASYEKHSPAYLIEIFVEDVLIDVEQVKPNHAKVERYSKELQEALGEAFEQYEERK